MMEDTVNLCALCGEPMPKGEETFMFHGYSGPCPQPPLPKAVPDLRTKLGLAVSDAWSTENNQLNESDMLDAIEKIIAQERDRAVRQALDDVEKAIPDVEMLEWEGYVPIHAKIRQLREGITNG